jgi:hypothetical protein
MRDYVSWHDAYDDPTSGLSWRLSRVRHHIAAALERTAGRPLTAVSLCAGDGRDLIGVLSSRTDAGRVAVSLVEMNPELAGRARDAAQGLPVRVLTADAGDPSVYAGLVPADLVLLVGIFGNIPDPDLENLIRSAPAFCRPGATVIWSRGRDEDIHDLNDAVRAWFTESGFAEIAYEEHDTPDRPSMGVMRYEGEPVPLDGTRRLFTFIR